jgi:hypothetical protein
VACEITREVWESILWDVGPEWAEIEAIWYGALATKAKDDSDWILYALFKDMSEEATMLSFTMRNISDKDGWATRGEAMQEFKRRIVEYAE